MLGWKKHVILDVAQDVKRRKVLMQNVFCLISGVETKYLKSQII